MLIVTFLFLLYVLKTFWYQLPEDSEIIEPKHVADM